MISWLTCQRTCFFGFYYESRSGDRSYRQLKVILALTFTPDSCAGRSLQGIIGPIMFGITALEFFLHLMIAALPEGAEILRYLHGPACR